MQLSDVMPQSTPPHTPPARRRFGEATTANGVAGPASAESAAARRTPIVASPAATTPLTWGGGIALLGVALWVPSSFAVIRAIIALFH